MVGESFMQEMTPKQIRLDKEYFRACDSLSKHWKSPYCVLGTEEYSGKQNSLDSCYRVYSLVLEPTIHQRMTQRDPGIQERLGNWW